MLIGHGTRSAAGREQFFQLTELLRGQTSMPVEPCFLELAEPAIEQAAARLTSRGVREIMVVPLLLFAAGHARRDVPSAVSAALQARPDVRWRQSPPLECASQVVALSTLRYYEALEQVHTGPAVHVAPEERLLLMVGRGSSDAEAVEKMHDFTRLRSEQTPTGWVQTCFCAVAEPSVDQALQQASGSPAKQIVVQPHLLFRGELLDSIEQQVAARRAGDHRRWLVTGPLGVHPLLAEAIRANVQKVLQTTALDAAYSIQAGGG